MAGPSTREASPRGNAATGTSDTGSSIPTIVVLLLLGLALRFIIAYVLLPGSGFPSDLSSFQGWSNELVAQTPLGFYDKPGFLDYPPVYLLFLWALGLLFSPLHGIGDAVKLIPIFGDLALAYLVYGMARELGASSRRATIAAVVVLFNPITWFNSAIWGQADVVGSIFMLLGLRALLRDRRELAAVFAVVAALTKIQLGILGVLVGLVILRRSLRPRDGQADPERVLTSLGAGLAAVALVCLPFTGLDFPGLAGRVGTGAFILTLIAGLVAAAGVYLWAGRWEILPVANRQLVAAGAAGLAVMASLGMVFNSIASHIINTFGEYPYLTLNAYNPWALVADADNAMARNLSWIRDVTFTDENGATQTGFGVGPFGSGVVTVAAVFGLVLVAIAVLAWVWAGSIDREAEEPLPESDVAPAEATPSGDVPRGRAPAVAAAEAGSGRSRPALSLSSELRATAVGCLIAVAALVFLLAGQSVLSFFGTPFGFHLDSLPAALVGDGFLIAILLGVGLWAAWRDDVLSIVVALAILAIAFFVVPTRAHERYLFPFFAVGVLLLAVSWRWTVAYVALAVVNTANLLAVLIQYKGIPGVQGADGVAGPISGLLGDWGHFLESARWPASDVIWPIALSAIVTGLGLLWALTQMRTRAVAVLAWEAERSGFEPEPPARRRPWAPSWMGDAETSGRGSAGSMAAFAGPPQDAGSGGATGRGAEGGSPEATVPDATTSGEVEPGAYVYDETDEWAEDEERQAYEDRPEFVPWWVMDLWHRLGRPSTRPDRSTALDSEPHGRLNKLDVWVVVALVVTILCMRVYRLDEPAQMHFDEVYHARTATEFLQDWRYNIPHDIYEWTHPHLAKYAIAGGLVAFSDDKVTATGNLGVGVKAALVQTRIVPAAPVDPNPTDARSKPDARLGDRLFVATGSEVIAFDLQTRTREAAFEIPGASSLSMAANTGDMYVGTTDGRIWRINVYSLDYARLGAARAPDPAAELQVQVGFAITHLYAGSAPTILAGNSTGDLVSMDGQGTIIARGHVDGASDFVALGIAAPNITYTPDASSSGPGSGSASPGESSPAASDSTASPGESPSASATPPSIGAEASALASVLGIPETDVEDAITALAASETSGPLPFGSLTDVELSSIQQLIDDGELPGIAVSGDDPQVAVAYADGVGILNLRTLTVDSTISTDEPATSIALGPPGNAGVFQSYVAAGHSILILQISPSGTGTITQNGDQPLEKMPGPVTEVVYDASSKIAQALGRTPDGSGWTVYAIETNGNAVFSDARLPFEPVSIGADATPSMPQTDRQELLALAPDGSMAAVDISQFAFAWRIVGVLFGALTAACLYLLARLLFKRRSVGLLVALFSCIDGMAFAQSRIAMNDTYVGGFLLLAYLLFAFLWLGDKTKRGAWIAFWVGMPLLGVVLGLALASKWVALYAIASIGVLILIRSALGRLVTILAMAAGTGVLGWTAIAEMRPVAGTGDPIRLVVMGAAGLAVIVGGIYYASVRARTTPDKVLMVAVSVVIAIPILALAMTFYPNADQNGSPNYTFFLLMLCATAIAAAANSYHPVAWSREEFRFAILAPLVIGILAGLGWLVSGSHTFELAAAAGIAGAPVIAFAFWAGGRLGFGPLAEPPTPDDPTYYAEPAGPAAQGWLRLGSGRGLPAAWMAACLIILPLFVYILLYIPWAMPWQQQTADTGPLPVLMCWHGADANGNCPTGQAIPAGHTGQTLMSLTQSMYDYHNDLRATHAASSPWWAWPFDLKPVWFESIGYAGDTGSMIYDGGNPILWWLAITGMAFVCWQAFKRRSLGLALIAVAFFWQWLSWSRIDRASFQYHFYTALPFFLLGLAYFMAELWHGPSRRTWLLARAGVAGLLLFPPFLWLAKFPLCTLARVDTSAPGSFQAQVCGSLQGDFRVETRVFWIAIVLVAALVALALILIRLERRSDEEAEGDRSWIFQLMAPVLVAGVLLLWLGANASHALLFSVPLPADLVVVALLPFFAVLAFVAITARDPRRFVLGLCVAAVVAFVLLYPNLSALPMPNNIVSAYNGFIPTWMYGFEFAVDLQKANPVPIDQSTAAIMLMTLIVAVAFGYTAWVRRVVTGYRRHERALLALGPDGDGGSGSAPLAGGDGPQA